MIEFPTHIRVGLTTDGSPRIHRDGPCWRLENLSIGNGFHWQQTISVRLPGEIEIPSIPHLVINTLPVEEYLRCVVGSEMNPAAPVEFLKAHAIISRSWACRMIMHPNFTVNHACPMHGNRISTWEDAADHSDDPYDVCADDHCQRYQGIQTISDVASQAISHTSGMVLGDENGDVADARFSKCCGGKTELFSTCWQDTDLPYLRSVQDLYCDLSTFPASRRQLLLAGILKDYDLHSRDTDTLWGNWTAEISSAELRRKILDKYGVDLGEIKNVIPIERGPSGRIYSLAIEGDKDSITIGKELTIRRLLAKDCLMSSAFLPTVSSRRLLMRGRGWGHGVGLCQIGAARMAAEGFHCEDILSFYYPGTKILKLY
ncbi:MAG: SpoIID/LytB domain-containing protein [Muribaculum sp.]|nr:SpoIID/LytB domain-containing protein [Muribaculum sp.]